MFGALFAARAGYLASAALAAAAAPGAADTAAGATDAAAGAVDTANARAALCASQPCPDAQSAIDTAVPPDPGAQCRGKSAQRAPG
jgi:hypothetical protein